METSSKAAKRDKKSYMQQLQDSALESMYSKTNQKKIAAQFYPKLHLAKLLLTQIEEKAMSLCG